MSMIDNRIDIKSRQSLKFLFGFLKLILPFKMHVRTLIPLMCIMDVRSHLSSIISVPNITISTPHLSILHLSAALHPRRPYPLP